MKYELPKLPYAYDALEPAIDKLTMEIHHTKHHQTYIDKLNAVLAKHPDLAPRPLEDLMRNFDSLPMDDADKMMFRNNGGGHLNHSLFWTIMGPAKEVDQVLSREIESTFGSIDEFKRLLSEAAIGRFGSGWAWLARDAHGKLLVYSTPNQDSPYLQNHTPVIGLDVWEHAYYLKYQNKRPDYIQNWWQVLKFV